MAYALICPLCSGKFRWNPLDGYPDSCKLCHASIGSGRADDDISMPAIIGARTKVADETYRQLETTSEYRASQAAELAGCSVSDMSEVKVTNIRDNLRQGEIAAVPVNNEVTQRMAAMQARGLPVGFNQGAGAGYSSTVAEGAFPNMGAKMRTVIAGMNNAPDRPALETLQPGYRRRG